MDGNTTTRRKNPLHELLVWLLMIWTPVLYIYLNNRPEPPKQSKSTPIGVTLNNSTGSPSKQEEHSIQSKHSGKEKETVNVPHSYRPSVKVAKRDDRGTNPVQPLNNETKHADSLLSEEPTDVAEQNVGQTQPERVEKPTEVASLSVERELPIAERQYKHTGSSYLAMVQRRISNGWHAPATTQPMEVIIGFKLVKSGHVSDVAIEQSSGNEYFDVAAKRAVLSASPLPPFPAENEEDDMTAHMRFSNEPMKPQ